MKYYIGVDMGTSSLKLIMVDEAGSILHQLSEDYDYVMPEPGWREISPAVWCQALNKVMLRLRKQVGEKMIAIAGIGVTGQMHTTCFLDEAGESIRPAIMWNDTRTVGLLPELKEKIATSKETAHIGNIISAGSPALNLYWLRKKEPDSFNKLKKFIIGPDYLVYYLTGYQGTDYCEASTSSLYDLYRGTWSKKMQKLIGLKTEQYPVINGSSEVVGEVKDSLAQSWGLNDKVAVIAGTGDNAAAAVATGAEKAGFAVMSLGTSGVLVFKRDKMDFSLKGKNIAFAKKSEAPIFLVQGVLQSCGRTINWWLNKIQHTNDFNAAFTGLSLDTAVRKKLLFYPHIMGDKTIYGDISLKGAFLGVSENDTRSDMLMAIMEGIAFATRELIERMAVPQKLLEPLRFTGGGAKNRLWLELMATILKVPVQAMPASGGAGYGAALLAMDNMPEEQVKKPAEIIYPRTEYKDMYQEKYKRYLKIHDALENIG